MHVNKKDGSKMIKEFLTLQNQLKIWHWQTESYAMHKSTEMAYDELSDLIDTFIEVFSGKYGKIKSNEGFSLTLENLSDNPIEFIDNNISYLLSELPSKLDKEKDTDLLNIKDEILACLNKLKYLLSLK
jgi:hypothetical protein